MKKALQGLLLLWKRRDGRAALVMSSVVFFIFLLGVQNGKATMQVFSLSFLSLYETVTLAAKTFFDVQNTFTTGALFLAIAGSLLGGVNIALAYLYMKIRGGVIMKSGAYQGIGLVLAFLGIGCAACGTALLSVLLSFFGMSATLGMLPYKGQEIGYLGIAILFFATYSLAKKVDAPNVC